LAFSGGYLDVAQSEGFAFCCAGIGVEEFDFGADEVIDRDLALAFVAFLGLQA
jgi:hypothetical protein